jgi:phospholipase/carboxylesterase
MPVSINGGHVMPAWYDIRHNAIEREEDEPGIRQSQVQVQALINEQVAQGFAAHNIVLAGFSQGGAIAYQVALRSPQALGGVVALSTYMTCLETLAQEHTLESKTIPCFIGHGTQDTVVPLERGKHAADLLKSRNQTIEWHTYPMAHSVCAEEVQDIATFLQRCFVNNPA